MINIIGGLFAIALGILTLIFWSWRVVELIQGLLPLLLLGGGIVALAAGMSMFKEDQKKKIAEMEDTDEDEDEDEEE